MDLKKFYFETAEEIVKDILNDFASLENDFSNKEKIEVFARNAHTLAGNSMQAGEYFVGFFCSKIQSFLDERKMGMSEDDYAVLGDFVMSLEKCFSFVSGKKKYIMDKGFVDNLNEIVKFNYEKLEKEFNEKLAKNK